MNPFKTLLSLLVLIGTIGVWVACTRYKDPTKPDITLTNKYCNDPIASNYNHGFPGVPDNSVCVYPTDPFVGTWVYVDSVYLPDLTFVSTQTYTLGFEAENVAIDTMRNRLTVSGFCTTSQGMAITANKYSYAFTDTLIEGSQGQQLFCQNTDTVAGTFRIISDSINTYMNINLTENKPNGTFIHNGKAIKQ